MSLSYINPKVYVFICAEPLMQNGTMVSNDKLNKDINPIIETGGAPARRLYV